MRPLSSLAYSPPTIHNPLRTHTYHSTPAFRARLFPALPPPSPSPPKGKSFIPRHVLWYRKTFVLPSAWAGSAVWLDFAGSFRNTTVWVNGVLSANHICG